MIKRSIYIGNPMYISAKDEQLVLRKPDDKDFAHTMPIEDLGYVELDHPHITVTMTALQKLAAENCAVALCDQSHLPMALVLPLSGHSVHTERMKPQLEATLPLTKRLWQQTIIAKIRNQAAVLKQFDKSYEPLLQKAEKVQSGDATNREAVAASYYWKTLFGKDFLREREGDYPNNLLNYGYAILRAIIARAIVGTGLLPAIGIHHHNRYNSYCLADDLMEPYRPFVDALVYQYFLDNPALLMLDRHAKQSLLHIPALDVGWGEETRPLMNAATLTAACLWKCYNGERKMLQYPVFLS